MHSKHWLRHVTRKRVKKLLSGTYWLSNKFVAKYLNFLYVFKFSLSFQIFIKCSSFYEVLIFLSNKAKKRLLELIHSKVSWCMHYRPCDILLRHYKRLNLTHCFYRSHSFHIFLHQITFCGSIPVSFFSNSFVSLCVYILHHLFKDFPLYCRHVNIYLKAHSSFSV